MNQTLCRLMTATVVGILMSLSISAQESVPVGSGSYASFTPLSKGRTDTHGGDQSAYMQTKKLWVTERPGQPIPTNDWWTGLINARFADALWSYPAMVHPSATGVTVYYPSYWNDNGTEVKWRSGVTVEADGFIAESAIAHTWHDWDVEMLMADSEGESSMLTTLMHGAPFTWVELEGEITPRLRFSDDVVLVDSEGYELEAEDLEDYEDSFVCACVGDDCYGIYFPAHSSLSKSGRVLSIQESEGRRYVVVGLLPEASDLEEYARWAYNIPRETNVGWSYSEKDGILSTIWDIEAENLISGESGVDVLQGFLPHAYKNTVTAPAFTSTTYLTPRGSMKMTEGHSFTFSYKFAGMLPWYAAPDVTDSDEHPYRPEVMEQLVATYATRGTFGDDTYWGGKGLTQMALNMTFALETGDEANFVLSRDKLKAKLIDWLTYTPGEENVYFAYYPRWGGLVGQATSYDSDTFNDHHFHYGYYTLAGALLCMVDDDFRTAYGPMLRLVAKDYANWDKSDKRFPFLRTLDPWVGHSYAGGLGDQGNSNGNGQESSSEAMQSWGGVYLLGVALDDKEMRDAGIFGWLTEAKATREYWFDVDHVTHNDGNDGNYDYSLYNSPYNSNITCKGIGWWTWFSNDPLHTHGIQWMPISTALDYMSWDRDFVAWAYDNMMNTPGWGHKWFEDGTNPWGDRLGMLSNDDWGNVALAYMQRAYPEEAAAIFDEAWQRGSSIATAVSTGHISYFCIHSHLTHGDIDWAVNADIPTANAFVNKDGEYTYIVYNPDAERDVKFYRDGTLVKTVRAPKGRMIAAKENPVASAVEILSSNGCRFPDSTQLSTVVTDQYGATIDDVEVEWSIDDDTVAQIYDNATLRFLPTIADGGEVIVKAVVPNDGITRSIVLKKGAIPYAVSGAIIPGTTLIEKGNPIHLSMEVTDQYGEVMDASGATWKIDGETVVDPIISAENIGKYQVTAHLGDLIVNKEIIVAPLLPDVARRCETVSSSEENTGTLTASVNDGDHSTRWGSMATDGQWIYIDLGKDYQISRVVIDWEAAYASEYLIETAPDGAATQSYSGNYHGQQITRNIVAEDEWQVAAHVTGVNDKGVHPTAVDATGRYVRMKAIERGTMYGVSIYEMQVCGIATDARPDELIGLDISCDKASVDEDKSLRFVACGLRLDGEVVAHVPVVWATTSGEIDSEGTFVPSQPGTAEITATTERGLTAAYTIVVNEVLKPGSINVSPSSVKIAIGETAKIEVEGLDQFGGIYPLSALDVVVTDMAGEESTGVDVDLSSMVITGLMVGDYTVKFRSGGITKEIAVSVVPLSEINLALNRPVIAGSGTNATAAVDGDMTTRWQAIPGQEQWLQVELEGVCLVDKVRVAWEAASATAYHVSVSTDGDTWIPVAANTSAPTTGNMIQTIGFTPIPVRYVRIVPDKLSSAAATYGVSIFEMEVYGISRFDTAHDVDAPVISQVSGEAEGGKIKVVVSTIDNSGYVYVETVAKENAIVLPSATSVTAVAIDGHDAEMWIEGLKSQTPYAVTVTAMDAAGNKSTESIAVTTGITSIEGVNLALNRPVRASSAENDALGASKAVDGDLNTRWGSQFNDNEWIEVDLESVYRIQSIRITTTDAAYASRALLEYSIDGNEWKSLGIREMHGIGTDEVAVANLPMRYIRYTGIARATGYGVSVSEIEIYGDARMLSVASVDGSDIKLEGIWDDTIFSSIDMPQHTVYDMTAVKDLPVAISVANPSCILFARTALDADCNVAVVGEDMVATATEIDLYEGSDFNSPIDINVTGRIVYHPLDESMESMAVMLPFALRATPDEKVYAFSDLGDEWVEFAEVDGAESHTPVLLASETPIARICSDEGPVLHKTSRISQPRHKRSASLQGTYRNVAAENLHVYNAESGSFDLAEEGAMVSSFGAYLNIGDSCSRNVRLGNTQTGNIDGQSGISEEADVYTIEGVCVLRRVTLGEALRSLAPGFYIHGQRKILIRK